MKFRLKQNLGVEDAKDCNARFGADLDMAEEALAAGSVVNLPDGAAKYLGGRYPALLEPVGTVRGVAPAARLKGDDESKPNPKPEPKSESKPNGNDKDNDKDKTKTS